MHDYQKTSNFGGPPPDEPEAFERLAQSMKDVPYSSYRKSFSFLTSLELLMPGESTIKHVEMDRYTTLAVLEEKTAETRTRFRNTISPAVARVKARTGGTYEVEIANTLMPSGRLFVIAVITRLT